MFYINKNAYQNCVVLHLILFILTLLFACPNCAFLFFLAKVEVTKIVYILPKITQILILKNESII